MSHSRLSPSSAHRWVHCPGSIQMSEQFPDSSGSAALEGEAAHWIGSEVLSGRGGDSFVGRTAPNGVVLTEEMEDAAKVYVGAIHKILNGRPAGPHCAVEKSITIPNIHPECHGTPDCAIDDEIELHIFDLKYGYGIVDPFDNWQLLCYAIGLLKPKHQFISLHIVQPRPFHYDGPHRTWRVGVAMVAPYLKQLQESAREALTASPRCVSGPHCKYCSARHACSASRKAAMFAIDYTSHMRAEPLPPEALSMELRTLERAEEAIQFVKAGLMAQATNCIKAGTTIPGWELRAGTGRKVWKVPVAEVIALSQVMGINLQKQVDTITPTQARKAGLPEELVNAYSENSAGEVKLTQCNMTKIANVFGTQSQGE